MSEKCLETTCLKFTLWRGGSHKCCFEPQRI